MVRGAAPADSSGALLLVPRSALAKAPADSEEPVVRLQSWASGSAALSTATTGTLSVTPARRVIPAEVRSTPNTRPVAPNASGVTLGTRTVLLGVTVTSSGTW